MKEVTKKILEAGLIDKTIAQLLERWHLLTPEEAALATKPVAVQEALEKFVENLEDLLDQETTDEVTDKPLRETRLEIQVKNPPVQYSYRTVRAGYPTSETFWAYIDEMGRLVSGPEVSVVRGSVLIPMDPSASRLEVLEVEDLYQGEQVVAKQITINAQ